MLNLLAVPVVQHLMDHWMDVFAGATFLGIVSHGLNSFPIPENKYGRWLLGVLQYAVGQRLQSGNTMGTTQQMKAAAASQGSGL